jgi:hypothetical protein
MTTCPGIPARRIPVPGRAPGTVRLIAFRQLLHCVLAVFLLSCTGCASWLPEADTFGAVRGVDAMRSMNGLGIHRKMWETAGAKCLYPQRLSPKLESFDVIVLVGKSFNPPGREARLWLEDWLGRKPGRTVIYFGRDFNAEVYYRENTLELLPAEVRDRGAQALAVTRARDLSLRIRQLSESTFCGWFYLDVSQPPAKYTADALRGSWSAEVVGMEGYWPSGVTLQEPLARWRDAKPSWLAPASGTSQLQSASGAAETEDEGAVVHSVWRIDEYATDQAWDAAFEDLHRSTVLLAGSDGRPCMFRLENDKKFPESQILISCSGAPLLNASLVDPLHRKLGSKLIEACLPGGRVALLEYDELGLLISNIPEPDARGVGLEVLTVWPLSGITMPAALLGIVVCTVLLPILGRAQSLPRRSVTDFGLHADAVGRMLQDAGDSDYAKQTIREYFEKVKEEAPPSWIEKD